MPKYTLVALANPMDAARDEKLAAWYDATHLEDILGIEGFRSAQRYKRLRLAPSKTYNQQYLCLYEFEAENDDDARAVINRINGANIAVDDSLDISSVVLGVYKAEGPFHWKEDGRVKKQPLVTE